MSSARDEVLARFATALVDAPIAPSVPRDYERELPRDVDMIGLFCDRVASYNATVRSIPESLIAVEVAHILASRSVRRVVVPPGLPTRWLSASHVESLVDRPALKVGALDAADAVVTGCAVAIAESGTLVLDGGHGQGRRALSLLPDRHICVVMAEQIVGTVAEALTRLDSTRPLTWITGPSATSDIELERIEGVHGPRILDVIVIVPDVPGADTP